MRRVTTTTGGRVLNRQWDDRRGRFETLAEFVIRAAESPPSAKVVLDGHLPGDELWTAVELLSKVVYDFMPREKVVYANEDYTVRRTFTDVLNGCLLTDLTGDAHGWQLQEVELSDRAGHRFLLMEVLIAVLSDAPGDGWLEAQRRSIERAAAVFSSKAWLSVAPALHEGQDVVALTRYDTHPQVRGMAMWVLREVRRNHARLVAMSVAEQHRFGRVIEGSDSSELRLQYAEGAEYRLMELTGMAGWPTWGLQVVRYTADADKEAGDAQGSPAQREEREA